MSRLRSSRSQLMGRIRGTDTAPELTLRRALWNRGYRYRKHQRIGRTRPDITFARSRVAIFVDGCFWHGCPEHYVRPRSSSGFWSTKLRDNVERDRRQTLELESAGWTVLRFWEHEVHTGLDECVACVAAALRGRRPPERSWRVVSVEPIDKQDEDLERWSLEDLRDHSRSRSRVRKRSTAKW